jgi:hypothetical protein
MLICFTACDAAGPKPPIEWFFSVQKAGATVITKLCINEEKAYYFCLKFICDPKILLMMNVSDN